MATINSLGDSLREIVKRRMLARRHWCLWVAALCLSVPFLTPGVHAADTLMPPVYYFLTPGAPTTVKLHTHTADIDLGFGPESAFAAVDALYRLQNSAAEAAVVELQVKADSTAEENSSDKPPNALPISFPTILLFW